jgi:hypothetical protein
MSRANNRTGFGNNSGSINPNIARSSEEPVNPKDKMIWIDESYIPPIVKCYRYQTTTWESLTGYGITDISFYSDGFITTYDDGTTEEWDWTLDGSDRITNLTNVDTGRTVDIVWNAGAKP